MNTLKKVGRFFFTLIALFACSDDVTPIENTVPEIRLVKAEFVEGTEMSMPDTLKITIEYKDKEGDLGLSYKDSIPPFHAFDYIMDNSGNKIRTSRLDTVSHYEVLVEKGDTFLIERNKFYENAWVGILVEKDGEFKAVDLRESGAPQPYWGIRFPPVARTGKIAGGPYEINAFSANWGTTTLKIPSRAYRVLFDRIKLSVRIVDRALHESNIVYSDEIIIPR